MTSRFVLSRMSTRPGVMGRPLGLLFVCLSLLLLVAPAASQDGDVGGGSDDVVLEKRLALTLEAPKDDLSPGDAAGQNQFRGTPHTGRGPGGPVYLQLGAATGGRGLRQVGFGNTCPVR